MANKKRVEGILSLALMFGPILIVPLVSPEVWGPAIGYYYLIPIAPLLVFGPVGLLLLIILSMAQWIVVIYLTIQNWVTSELEIDTIEEFKNNAAKYERYLGLIIVGYIASYFYYLIIAWYSGLDILSPKEALDVALQFIQPDGSDY